MGALYFFDVITILSNTLLVVPILLSFHYGLYFHTVMWILVFVASMLYHLCYQEVESCVGPLIVLETVDTILAVTGFFMCVLMMLYFLLDFNLIRDISIVLMFHVMLVCIVLFTGDALSVPSLVFEAIFIIAFILIVMWTFLCKKKRCSHYGKWQIVRAFQKRVDVSWYIASVILSIVALIFFQLHILIGEEYYPVTHSLWHILMTTGISMGMVSIRSHRQRNLKMVK